MLLQRGGQFGAFSVGHRYQVLDGQRIQHLAAKALGKDAGVNTLARCIQCGSRTCRATADHQHIKGIPCIDFGDDFLQRHASLTEVFTIEQDTGYRHHLTIFHFFLKEGAVDHHALNAGIEYRHQVECLHHIGTVVAGQRDKGFKAEVALNRTNLFGGGWIHLGRVTANLEQGQHQRGEFVAHGNPGKMDPRLLSRHANGK